MDCVFCKIINGEIPSYKIYEDDKSLAFLNIKPQTDGHALVIPKKHYNDMYEIPKDIQSHLNEVTKKVAKLITEKLNAGGVTIVQNNGFVPEVNHFHYHIIPRYEDDDLQIIYPRENLKPLEEIHKNLT